MDIRTEVGKFPMVAVSRKINAANAILPRNLQWFLYVVLLIATDSLIALFSFQLAHHVRYELLTGNSSVPTLAPVYPYLYSHYFISVFWVITCAINGLYSKRNLLHGNREYSMVLRSVNGWILLIVVLGFLNTSLTFARDWLLLWWSFLLLLLCTSRLVLRRIVYALRREGFFLTPAIIVGANQEGRWLAEQLIRWESSGLHVVGFVDNKIPATFPLFHDLASLGSVEQLGAIIERYNIGEVILASSAFSTRDHLVDIFRTYNLSNKVNIRMSSGLYEILTTGLTVNEFAYVPLVYVNKVRLTGMDSAVKATLDYAITVTGLIVLSPLLLLIGLLVRISSPGPIFYKRKVLGLNGKDFFVYKFRTMMINGDEILDKYPDLKGELARTHKLKNDPRITRIGVFLRKYSLDELPQLLNVLKRNMSLVGPRMIPPSEVSMYQQFDMNLLTVLPGITGLWQVSGRSDISYEERVRLDMYYIRNWSIWLDLRILFQTIPVVLTGRGAY